MKKKATKFFGLGGFQEIGKSTCVIEHDDKLFIVDAGIQFANGSMTGIKGKIPDYTYLIENEQRIEGLFLTHGHEDHMGGIPYLAERCQIKRIVAPPVGIAYLKLKFDERKISKRKIEFIEINRNLILQYGDMKIDFWTAQHSIPDAFGIRFSNRNGSILFTGDFRIDYTPIGNIHDFEKLQKIGDEGLTVLFSDSTNAMRPFHSPSEKDILKDIRDYMEKAPKKIIVTAFASNMIRIGALIKVAAELNKKVVSFGRSMINGVNIARDLGHIDVDPTVFIDRKQVSKYDDNELLILTTGSQGEQMAALAKMAEGKHAQIHIKHNDLIIFSSSPIPGNRIKIELLINALYKLGADIKENRIDGYLHTSGHAYQEEHEKIFSLTRPKYFFPYHGEFRMSVAHGQTAIKSGVKPENVIIAAHGESYQMLDGQIIKSKRKINHGPVYIDGDVPSVANTKLIKEREILGENGFVHIIVVLDREKNDIVGRAKIITRGTLYVKSSTDVIIEIRRLVHGAILYKIKNTEKWNSQQIKKIIHDRIRPYFYKLKRRIPYISTTIQYINDANVMEPTPEQLNEIMA